MFRRSSALLLTQRHPCDHPTTTTSWDWKKKKASIKNSRGLGEEFALALIPSGLESCGNNVLQVATRDLAGNVSLERPDQVGGADRSFGVLRVHKKTVSVWRRRRRHTNSTTQQVLASSAYSKSTCLSNVDHHVSHCHGSRQQLQTSR